MTTSPSPPRKRGSAPQGKRDSRFRGNDDVAVGVGAVRAGSARCGADLSAADRPRRRPGAPADARAGRRTSRASRRRWRRRPGAQLRRSRRSTASKAIRSRIMRYRLGRAWGIGQKGKDNGVILLVAPNEHKVWIATGYGAGGLPDRRDVRPDHPRGDPAALQAEPPIMAAGSRPAPTRSSSR